MFSKKRAFAAAMLMSVLYCGPIFTFDLIVKHLTHGKLAYFAIALPATGVFSFVFIKHWLFPHWLMAWVHGAKPGSAAEVTIEFSGTPGFKINKGLRLRASSARSLEKVYVVTEDAVVDERGRALIKARELVSA